VTHPAEASNFDEIEAQLNTEGGEAAKALEAKLDGDNVPEEFRGKTVAEVVEAATKRAEALKQSEAARQDVNERVARLEATAGQPAVTVAAPVVEPEEVFGAEEFKKLYADEPAEALLKLQATSEKRMAQNFDNRFTPLVTGSAQGAEAGARAQHKEEFELFGDQIDEFIQMQLGGDRTRVTTPKAWDDLLSYIRGKPANIEKIFEARTAKAAAKTAAEAQEAAVEASGFDGTSGARRVPVKVAAGELDTTEKEIADTLGLTDDEYKKWKAVA